MLTPVPTLDDEAIAIDVGVETLCQNTVVKRHSVDGGRLRKRVSIARFAAIYPVGPVVVAHHCRRIPSLLRDTG